VLSRLNCVTSVTLAILLCFGFGVRAQTAAVASAPTAPGGVLRGHITDPTGALIPGAQVTVTTAKGAAVAKATADAAGGYVVRGLAAGSYIVQAEFTGFAAFVSKPIALEAGQTKNVDVKMAIEQTQQDVEVTADGAPTVSTDPSANASAVVLKGKDLDALSDDPDELSNELTALAGPSAGPNGGQIYIDGFTGGQLPPKSAIREIRINQNPFSAEFDRLGYGRIEILTKPGTDQLHGRGFMMGNDDAFNTGNPFTNNIPAYHSIQGNATVSGPMSKNSSFFVSFEQRNIQDASIYTADTAVLDTDPTSPTYNTYIPETVSGGLFAPSTHTVIAPRLDFQLGQKNTLTLRWQFFRTRSTGSIGSTSLPSTNATSQNIENTLQFDDTQIINDRVVEETRFEYRRASNWETPFSTAPSINVPAYFSSGGNETQSTSGNSDHYELQEFVTMTAGAHAIKFGTWMRDNRQATSASSGFNGTFNFPTLDAYIFTMNHLSEMGTAQFNTDCTTAQQNDPTLTQGCLPNSLTYTAGPYAFSGNLFDAAAYIQDDWKYNRFLTLSGGLRWESQNHVSDHSDFAPRVAFAYALDGHKNQKQAKTVLRGGFGFFYDRFQIADLMNLEQYNGVAGHSQTTTVVRNPTCFDPNSLQTALAQGCTGSNASPETPQIDAITPGYHSPYAEQLGASLERQLTRTSTLTFTYLHSFGVHQMVIRDANPYQLVSPGSYYYSASAGLPRLNPNLGIVDQYFPEAVYKQNQIIANINAQFSRKFSMSGFYNWTDANSNGGGESNPSNSYDLDQDYGRAAFVRPQFLFLMGNYNAPWGLTFSPFLVAQAGRPYSITTDNDLTGDNFFNNRPAIADSNPSNPNNVAQTQYGAFDTDPQPEEALVAPDTLWGPSSVALNLRVSRAFGLGPSTETSAGPSNGRGDHSGGGHGQGGGPGFGGGFFGGGGRGAFGGGPSTGHKYSLTFSAQALNLFNDVDYGTPSGTVIPTLNQTTGIIGPGDRFGESTKLAGGMFNSSTGSAVRRIFVQAFFTF
jgi:hypothetical protein